MNKLIVQLVTWNGGKYIPFLFESLKNQTYKDWKLVILDNGSADNTASLIDEELKDFPVEHEFIKSAENTGFAGGHNMLFKNFDSEFVVLLNQDMFLEKNCLEVLVEYASEHKQIGALAPRLMRWDFSLVKNDASEGFTNDIDALGLKVFRNRRAIEQYTKQNWNVLSKTFTSDELPVFGVSGAFPLYRRTSLEAVAYKDGGMFDETYHAYKEDLDLAYRLRSAGYHASVLLDVVAYHDRSGAGPKATSDTAAMKNRKTQSEWVKYHSYKNHLMTLYKNERWQSFTLDLPWILWYELRKFVFILLFDTAVLKGLAEVTTNGTLNEKKKRIESQRKISWKEMRKWWTQKPKQDSSYGVIVRRNGNEYLIIQQKNGDWGFPKGHPEKGESGKETAVRELREETGIHITTLELSGEGHSFHYSFELFGNVFHKTVTFYTVDLEKDCELEKCPKEIEDARWLTKQAAIEQLSFANTKEMLRKL
jgi:GT2 family glycosyltransferase/8-oxo-dGTP pyrophosphatase MutT (NUDIX family)